VAQGDKTLDLVGLKCPYPVLRARRAIGDIPVGGCLVVIATDPLASLDLNHFCVEGGHLMESETVEGDRFTFTIRRGR
jgi:tRNA 2-thiouridine synthesizing protein A